MSDNFTMKTASMRAVNTDSLKIDAKKISSEKIILGGKDLQELLDEGTLTYPEMMKRKNIPEDAICILYDDNSDWVYTQNLVKMIINQNTFRGQRGLKEINFDTSKVKNFSGAFSRCEGLTNAEIDASGCINFYSCFRDCINLKSLKIKNINSSITNIGEIVYNCNKLETFICNTSNITHGNWGFQGCSSLKYLFDEDGISLPNFSNLKEGYAMFDSCGVLEKFYSSLPSLVNGNSMFRGCKLDTLSVETILNSIPVYTDGTEHLLQLTMDKSAIDKFKEITNYSGDISTAIKVIDFKGWKLSFNYKK